MATRKTPASTPLDDGAVLITIGGKQYPTLPPMRRNRAQIKTFRAASLRLAAEQVKPEHERDDEALYPLLAATIPAAPVEDIDAMPVGDVIDALVAAGVVESPDTEITVGESSASTTS